MNEDGIVSEEEPTNNSGADQLRISQRYGLLVSKEQLLDEDTFPEVGKLMGSAYGTFISKVGARNDLKITIILEMDA